MPFAKESVDVAIGYLSEDDDARPRRATFAGHRSVIDVDVGFFDARHPPGSERVLLRLPTGDPLPAGVAGNLPVR